MSAQGLPAHILALFTPRPPPQHLPSTVLKSQVRCTGCAEYVEFFGAEAPPDREAWESPKERKDRRNKEKLETHQEQLKGHIEKYDPHKDTNASGDPFKTLFVGRISYDTTEKKLKREFEVFGSIKKVRMVYDQKGKPRGYAFIEFEHERDLKNAYKQGDGKKIDGRRVMVDVERGRTVEGWLPRRLGGGRGPGRQGKPSKKKKLAQLAAEKAEREKKRDEERDEKKEREKDRGGDKDRGKDRDRDRGDKDRDRGGGDRDRAGKDRDRDRDDRGGRDRGGDKDKPREDKPKDDRAKDKDRGDKDKDKGRDKGRDRDADKGEKRKDKDRERSRSRDRGDKKRRRE